MIVHSHTKHVQNRPDAHMQSVHVDNHNHTQSIARRPNKVMFSAWSFFQSRKQAEATHHQRGARVVADEHTLSYSREYLYSTAEQHGHAVYPKKPEDCSGIQPLKVGERKHFLLNDIAQTGFTDTRVHVCLLELVCAHVRPVRTHVSTSSNTQTHP